MCLLSLLGLIKGSHIEKGEVIGYGISNSSVFHNMLIEYEKANYKLKKYHYVYGYNVVQGVKFTKINK